ncbi:PAS domain S-box protein [Chlorogloeopsis sp. ULAP01]|uniref:PAS domain S-box protein n=1 Tax=Chlorogloeopsis sp. ULAP01 TaxID=3056483 RepID=UPI0025AA9CEC|nr:PAS domain S-box protein [Chlorogloeopsis sp. ULAP01]MDM9383404.1 PAS domain S-box protein [Chlorogloeopsis sp. ULAP01]
MLKVQFYQLQRYSFSILSVLSALLLGLLLEQLLRLEVSLLFCAAIAFSSWYGGFATSLVATVLAVFVNNYFFLPPFYSLLLYSGDELLQLVIFSLVALLISWLISQLRNAKQKSEAELAKLQVSYRRLFETANEGIWIFDSEGKTEYVNQRLAQMLGYSVEQMLGCSIFEFMDHQARIEVEQWLEQQRQSVQEAKQQFDLRLRHQDKSELWTILSTSAVLDTQGEFSGAIAMLTDITKHKQVEVALRESGERYRSLVVATSQMVWTTQPDGQVVDMPDWRAYTGQTQAQVKGWGWLEALHPDDRERTARIWTHAVQTKSIYENEYRIRGADGIYRYFSARGVPVATEDGKIREWVGVCSDITYRKQAEKALRQSEAIAKARAEELETFMETVPAAVWIASDPQCHHMTANRTAYKLMRLPPDSVITATPADAQYPFQFKIQKNGQDIPLTELPMQQAARTGKEIEGEFEFVFSQDDVRSIYGKAVPLRDDSGAVRGAIGAFIDVTERKQTEAALRQKQEWLDLAQAAAKVGSFEWNIQTNVNTWSKELEAIYGLEPGEFGGTYEEWAKWVHPDDLANAEADMRSALQTGEFFTDWRVIWKDGSIHWLHGRARVFYDDDGKPLKMLGINVDITDRKRAEIALKASEARFRRIVDSNIIGVFFCDMSGNITQANDAFLQMVGYAQEDLLAGKLDWQEMTPPEHIEQTEQAVEELKLYGVCTAFEKEFFRKDGSRVFVAIAAALFEDTSEQGFACVLDITARKQAEAERDRLLQLEQAARAEAEAANRIKDDFLAIVSHELRSPLNPILGWSKLLLTRKLDAAKTTQALETIERNAKLQTRLIDDLLDVSRILRGKLSLNVCAVDLVSTIEAALETVRLAAEAKSIQIYTHFDSGVGKVEGDPNRLQQVVWNLLSNAIKFTSNGGQVEVRLGTGNWGLGTEKKTREEDVNYDSAPIIQYPITNPPSGSPVATTEGTSATRWTHQSPITNYAQITVTDTGKGISPDFLPYVFERFRQADEATTRKFGGLGLGLAIVRHIVELHGGSIQVASLGEGLGATFTVTLPLINDVSQTSEDNSLPETSANLQGLRVVVVDDDVDTLNLLVLILEQYGVEVHGVASAREALLAIAQIQPDLLLSDIAMPETDGYMLIRQVRALEAASLRKLPAIALTAFAGEVNYQKVISAGFQRHLTKPVDPSELAMAIAALTRRNS